MTRICAVEGCERPHGAKGWCRTHYYAVRRGENPQTLGPIKERTGPKPNIAGYVPVAGTYAHRLVMQGMIGRELLPTEQVHHRNGNRSDNTPGNLELWYVSQPRGQRIDDLIQYIATHHSSAMRAALDGDSSTYYAQ